MDRETRDRTDKSGNVPDNLWIHHSRFTPAVSQFKSQPIPEKLHLQQLS